MALSEDMGTLPAGITIVAVDKDKHSQYAVKWAIDHLTTSTKVLFLIHVQKTRSLQGVPATGGGEGAAVENDPQEIFVPHRAYCGRKSIQPKEVILEDVDVAKALLDYINTNCVANIVLRASSRSAFMKTFKKLDVPSVLSKSAPDFCSVYVIAKSRVVSVRSAQRPIVNNVIHPRQLQLSDEPADDLCLRPSSCRVSPSPAKSEKLYVERNGDNVRGNARQRAHSGGLWKNSINPSMESIDLASGQISARNSLSEDDTLDPLAFGNSLELTQKNLDFSVVNDASKGDSNSPLSTNAIEVEMRRLRLELKQTMDMYSTACKEAIIAKQKAKELNEWKTEELRKYEQVKSSEEQALAIIEMEKAKCRAAMEAAEAAKKLAEQEAQKRKYAEMKAKREAEKTDRVLTTLAKNDVRYRKYTINEIEVATEKFASKFKVGEGGYGPVYKGVLDHTPVAIKILRPDAAQGRKQFQQEVEVLSCMRHPHMVLLLGACPEYGCLVYEYMNNGSLEDRLFKRGGTPPVPWRIRFKIAAEIPTALTFLHQAKPEPLVHRDLKPANILLDRNYVSKISDVGLARLVPPSVADSVTQYRMTSAAGTFCYIDPEYQQTGMLTTKSDIYSLGIMLLQIIIAKPPMGLSHQVQRAIDTGTFNEVLDPAVPDWPVEEALAFAKLALKCCELRKKDRPDLATVILPELNRLSEFGMGGDANYFYFNFMPSPTTTNSSGLGSCSRPKLQSARNRSPQQPSTSS